MYSTMVWGMSWKSWVGHGITPVMSKEILPATFEISDLWFPKPFWQRLSYFKTDGQMDSKWIQNGFKPDSKWVQMNVCLLAKITMVHCLMLKKGLPWNRDQSRDHRFPHQNDMHIYDNWALYPIDNPFSDKPRVFLWKRNWILITHVKRNCW